MKISESGLDKDRLSNIFTASVFYTLLTILGIWALEDIMVIPEWKDVDWMMTEVILLGSFSCLVFFREYIYKLEGTGRKVLAAGTMAAMNLAGLGMMIYKSPRIRVILYSLGVHLFDTERSLRDVNWLDYRLEAVKANWSGYMEPGFNRLGHDLMEGEVWLTWKKNPLSCLNAEYGKAALLVFLILFAGVMFFTGRIPYRDGRLKRIAWYIRAELIMMFVSSTLNELFLVQAGVGMGNYFPLLGYGVQVFSLLSILYSLDGLGEMKEDGRTESCSIKPHRLRWKKGYTFLTILILLPALLGRIYHSPFEMDSYASADIPPVLIPEETYTYQAWEDGGVYYAGKQEQGQMEGFGSERSGGRFFFGNHTNGIRDGYGLLKAEDGSFWMGRYRNGVMRGGLWIYDNGSWEMESLSPDGIMEADKLRVIQYDYGDYYYGEVDNGKPEGYGQYYSPAQEYFYMGEFQDGKRSGSGAWYTTSSPENISMMAGTWDDGLFCGKGIWARNPETGFEEGEWYHEAVSSYASQLEDGSWFYRSDLKPCGIHIIYQADGGWYYCDKGKGSLSSR